MNGPDFIVIGAAKSGTTSLYQYLSAHPEICMSSVKETNFFCWYGCSKAFDIWGQELPREMNVVTSRKEYAALFSGCGDRLRGEVSPSYLFSKSAPDNIKECNRETKILVVLRNPVDRAYSGYQMNRRLGRTKLSIDKAFTPVEPWVRQGFYYAQLIRYFDRFPVKNIKILFFEDLVRDLNGFMCDVFDFLSVDTHDVTEQGKYNVGGIPRVDYLSALLRNCGVVLGHLSPSVYSYVRSKVRPLVYSKAPVLPIRVRDKLKELYMSDCEHLQRLTERNLNELWGID
jgi:hypothetical protein